MIRTSCDTGTGTLPVSRISGNVPRYDVPKKAPEPLLRVQQFLNSIDLEHEVDWLPAWLDERGLAAELERGRVLRTALRSLAIANTGEAAGEEAVAVVNAASARLSPRVDAGGQVHVATEGDELDQILAWAVEAMLDGSWARLKACRNCHWSFYDYSPNRSAAWCSMQLCGNRAKTRAYRRRKSTGDADARAASQPVSDT
jgi:predicted RNA-binding Zn ribbon-like protein